MWCFNMLVIPVMIRKLTTLDQLFNEKIKTKIAIKNEGLAKLKRKYKILILEKLFKKMRML